MVERVCDGCGAMKEGVSARCGACGGYGKCVCEGEGWEDGFSVVKWFIQVRPGAVDRE